MKLNRLYLENFMCFEKTALNFSEINAALIIGKGINNLHSNGVGKSSLFRAIEYVLFNKASSNLEKFIRDGQPSSKVSVDINCDEEDYRIIRTRSRKGTADLSLYKRTSNSASDDDINDISCKEDAWKNISSRRALDTEKDIAKLIKFSYEAFSNVVHFRQNDFTGLTTASPADRKKIFKEALNCAIYSKLEKIAKEDSSALLKEIDKKKLLKENLADPLIEISNYNLVLKSNNSDLILLNSQIKKHNEELETSAKFIESLNINKEKLISDSKSSLILKKNAETELEKTSLYRDEVLNAKKNLVSIAKSLISEINTLKKEKEENLKLDFDKIDILKKELELKKDLEIKTKVNLQSELNKLKLLQIPLPIGTKCESCRSDLSEEHLKICQLKINEDIDICSKNIEKDKIILNDIVKSCLSLNKTINELELAKNKINIINTKIESKDKEIIESRKQYDESVLLFDKLNAEHQKRLQNLEEVNAQLAQSNYESINKIISQIEKENESFNLLKKDNFSLNEKILNIKNNIAILNNNIKKKQEDLLKVKELTASIEDLEENYRVYPIVLQGLSSSGIPNLIIQNVLDDLQVESNKLLQELKPGLQLEFVVEKTKADGTIDDTLDIKYFINGKERDYELISGGMKLAVNFSIKIGFLLFLQKIFNTEMKLLLLDEIDQPLDKASIDALVEIIRFFQKDFMMLIITHNDRLQDTLKNKFNHAIVVEQDSSEISTAKIVDTW